MLDLRGEVSLDNMQAIDVRPALGTFDLPDARLIAPGDPARSVLIYRMAKSGAGSMPRLSPHEVDSRGLALVTQWIAQMKPGPTEAATVARRQMEREAVKELRAGKLQVLDRLTGSTSACLDLILEWEGLAEGTRSKVVARGAAHSNALVRDLFERFLPPQQRAKRLGDKFDPASVLGHQGNRERGRSLFFERAGLACASCHTVAGRGESFGPDLSKIGAKYNRREMLEHIVRPSKHIDPKYVPYVVELNKGSTLTGLILEKTSRTIVLRDAEKREYPLPIASIVSMTPQKVSSMPENLLRDLTEREAADLIDFLVSLQ